MPSHSSAEETRELAAANEDVNVRGPSVGRAWARERKAGTGTRDRREGEQGLATMTASAVGRPIATSQDRTRAAASGIVAGKDGKGIEEIEVDVDTGPEACRVTAGAIMAAAPAACVLRNTLEG